MEAAVLSRFPAHANLDDPKEAALWERWAAVGDAKIAAAEATAIWHEACTDYVDCQKRYYYQRGVRPPKPNCGCADNACFTRTTTTMATRDAARAAIEVAEAAFKSGDG